MPITEATIRSLATTQSFERGEDYYHSGMVYDLQKRGDLLTAEVEGSSYDPYQVTIELTEDDDILSTDCTCPYDWEGDCKHIVAVLLTYIRRPQQVSQLRPVDELLANLGEAELRELLTDLLTTNAYLIDWVEIRLSGKAAPPPVAPEATAGDPVIHLSRPQPAPVDLTPFRRQARQILRAPSGRDYYAAAVGVAHQISELADQARPYLEAGDGRNALLILEAVVEPYVEAWIEFDDSDGELSQVFGEIGPLLTEAILSADLSPAERKAWAEKLTGWAGEIADYGLEDDFDAAIAAAEQGWDYPPLLKVLQEGHITETGAWEGEAPWYADELALARLNVLERQGRTTEYLYLAEAEGQTARYLTMVVKLDRSEEAVQYAMRYMATTDEALALATALREHNHPLETIKMADHGLSLQGETLNLARWLRDFAAEMFQADVALRAARVAFARSYSLEDYQAAAAVAGAEWPTVKAELLDQLAAAEFAYGRLDIYLHEGMVEEAIKTVEAGSYYGYETLERVVEAALPDHPEWVIQQCKKQAERIMDSGKSQHYYHAIRWLEKARQACLQADKAQEWREYLEGLITTHSRKYSLRPRLERLRNVRG